MARRARASAASRARARGCEDGSEVYPEKSRSMTEAISWSVRLCILFAYCTKILDF